MTIIRFSLSLSLLLCKPLLCKPLLCKPRGHSTKQDHRPKKHSGNAKRFIRGSSGAHPRLAATCSAIASEAVSPGDSMP